MTRWQPLILLALASTSTGGCGPAPVPGTPVVLNERIFSLPSMESAGKACATYHLSEHSSRVVAVGGGGAGYVPGLFISQSSSGALVLIQVTEGARVIAERRYGEDFFRAGKLDEFVAQGSSGERKLLRYWGAIAAEGTVGCAPYEDEGDSAR